MEYSKYLEVSSFSNEFKDWYPVFYTILESKFFDYNILYEIETLDKLIFSFLLENHVELSKNKELDIQLLEVFKKENYGTFTKMDVENENNDESNTILSYEGFNTDGDFNKTSNNHIAKSNNKTNQKSVNNLEIFISLNQLKLNGIYENLVKQFGNKFLQLWYN